MWQKSPDEHEYFLFHFRSIIKILMHIVTHSDGQYNYIHHLKFNISDNAKKCGNSK